MLLHFGGSIVAMQNVVFLSSIILEIFWDKKITNNKITATYLYFFIYMFRKWNFH